MSDKFEFRSAGERAREAMWRQRFLYGISGGWFAGVVVGFVMGRML